MLKRMLGSGRRGFLLFIVIAVLLAIAIMAFSLSSFKSGAVELLGKTMDQNRLATLAQSANHEVIGMVKTQVNRLGTDPHNRFREFFQPGGVGSPYNPVNQSNLPKAVLIYDDIQPPGAKALADAFVGLGINLKSRAVLTVTAQRNLRGYPSYVGHLEVTSRAYYGGKYNNSVEVKERRDVKMIDMHDLFDKYALFVKNYSPDYNNPNRRLIVEGISPQDWANEVYTRVYLGSRFYPEAREFESTGATGAIYLDINLKDYGAVVGKLLNSAAAPTPQNFTWANSSSKPSSGNELPMIWVAPTQAFSSIFSANGYQLSDFYFTHEIMRQYEFIIHSAACAALGQTGSPPPELKNNPPFRGQPLINKAQQAWSAIQGNVFTTHASVRLLIKDFLDGMNNQSNKENYSGCQGFMQVLQTHIDNWPYCFGYTDADSLWNYENKTKSTVPLPLWNLSSMPTLSLPEAAPEGLVNRYSGLSALTGGSPQVSRYVYENAFAESDTGSDKPWNLEKMFVGRMASLYGAAGNTPVFIEGNVFLRLFKVAFFEEFTKNLSLFNWTFTISPPSIPLNYRREAKMPETFLNRKITGNLRQGQVGRILPTDDPENYLMSRAVCGIPANRLLDQPVAVRDPDGGAAPNFLTQYNPLSAPPFPDPQQIPGPKGKRSGERFFPPIDYSTFSHNFKTPQEFLKEQVAEENGEPVLYIDGRMYIAEGDLDLVKGLNNKPIKKFKGRGFLFLSKGNLILTSFRKGGSASSDDSIRIFLQDGDFIVGGTDSPTRIDASLIALTFTTDTSRDPKDLVNQGQLLMRGKSVVVTGNLVVDYLALELGSDGLPMNGTLTIVHDPEIFEPANGEDNPYRFSIGGVRTFYSMNSGDPTLN